MERRVLGKGLDALIPKKVSLDAVSQAGLTFLPLENVHPGRYQPRHDISSEELKELVLSIKERGVLQPILVRQLKTGYFEIIAGQRRFEAARAAGLKEIPAIVKDVGDKDTLVLAIVENLQRQDLNPLEEAEAFSRLMKEFEFTLEDVARSVAKDKTTVSNTLRLLRLPDGIKDALSRGLLSRSQARTILAVDGAAAQEKLFHQIMREGLSVRDIESRVKQVSVKKKSDLFGRELEEKLQKCLGTKVRIFNKKNNCGRIVIEYYNLQDLERLVERLR
jgi:ParB family transcriptional regulator, chromosome partitioning protein